MMFNTNNQYQYILLGSLCFRYPSKQTDLLHKLTYSGTNQILMDFYTLAKNIITCHFMIVGQREGFPKMTL